MVGARHRARVSVMKQRCVHRCRRHHRLGNRCFSTHRILLKKKQNLLPTPKFHTQTLSLPLHSTLSPLHSLSTASPILPQRVVEEDQDRPHRQHRGDGADAVQRAVPDPVREQVLDGLRPVAGARLLAEDVGLDDRVGGWC